MRELFMKRHESDDDWSLVDEPNKTVQFNLPQKNKSKKSKPQKKRTPRKRRVPSERPLEDAFERALMNRLAILSNEEFEREFKRHVEQCEKYDLIMNEFDTASRLACKLRRLIESSFSEREREQLAGVAFSDGIKENVSSFSQNPIVRATLLYYIFFFSEHREVQRLVKPYLPLCLGVNVFKDVMREVSNKSLLASLRDLGLNKIDAVRFTIAIEKSLEQVLVMFRRSLMR